MYRSTTGKYLSSVLIFCTIVLFVITTGCRERTKEQPDNDPDKKTIRLSHSHPANYSSELHFTAWIFKQYIESQTESIEVRIYPANALGQEREVYEAIQLGSGANCIISGTAILNNFIPICISLQC
jgi:TRAP-type C4-dicarboxylate transport system substrate-binding protein